MRSFLVLMFTLLMCSPSESFPMGSWFPWRPVKPVEESKSQPLPEQHSGNSATMPTVVYPVPKAKGVFTVKIEDENYTAAQKEKVALAAKYIAKVANSDEFKQAILDHTFDGKKQFDSNKGLTNEEIYKKLMEGAEALIPAVNYQMDLKVKMYYDRGKVIGWTKGSIMVVNTNSKFHNSYDACDVAGNLYHEWTHKLGFDHKSAKSHNSVPYATGYLMEKLCYKMK